MSVIADLAQYSEVDRNENTSICNISLRLL